MPIDNLGDGLSVVIACEATGLDNFLAFASWYSFSKNLPDARVAVACRRPDSPRFDAFRWVRKVGVPFFYHKTQKDPVGEATARGHASHPVLRVPPDVMCLAPFGDGEVDLFLGRGVVDGGAVAGAAAGEVSALCSVRGGCGSFVPAAWIDNGGHPFGKADRFFKGQLTLNERRIFSLWKKSCPLYDHVV